MTLRIRAAFLAAIGGFTCACAAWRVPSSEFARVEKEVRDADEAGARDAPAAALHVVLARQRLQQAAARSDRNDPAGAKQLLDEASVEAELATVLVRQREAKQRANQAQQQVQLRVANGGRP